MFTSIILQFPDGRGGWTCVQSNVHAGPPEVRIVVAPGDASTQSDLDAAQLAAALRRQLLLLGLGPVVPAGPCGGQMPAGGWCPLPFQRELLVLLGDGSAPLVPPLGTFWPGEILPVLPASAEPHAARLLARLGPMRVAVFHPLAPQSVAATVLRAAGVLEERPRVFLSYKRGDTATLALQLFRELTEQQFEVFLDGCALAPAHVLTQKIRAQLGNKGIVLVLASPNYLRSVWCRMELATAAALNLGMVVVAAPHAPPLALTAGAPCIRLQTADFAGGHIGPQGTLLPAKAERVARVVREQYDRVLLRKRQRLMVNTTLALRQAGCSNVAPASNGCLIAHLRVPGAGGPQATGYRLALTHRSPETDDFYRAAHPATHQSAVVVGLNSSMEPGAVARRIWLEAATAVRTADSARLTQWAPQIAGGTF